MEAIQLNAKKPTMKYPSVPKCSFNVRTALQNAASVSGLMLTTETLIAEKPKKDEKAAGGHEGHGHDFD